MRAEARLPKYSASATASGGRRPDPARRAFLRHKSGVNHFKAQRKLAQGRSFAPLLPRGDDHKRAVVVKIPRRCYGRIRETAEGMTCAPWISASTRSRDVRHSSGRSRACARMPTALPRWNCRHRSRMVADSDRAKSVMLCAVPIGTPALGRNTTLSYCAAENDIRLLALRRRLPNPTPTRRETI